MTKPINPELERELAEIQGIEIFGSVLDKPLDEAHDIDLAIERGLIASEREMIGKIASKYNKPVELFCAEYPLGLQEGAMVSKQIFLPGEEPYWEDVFAGKYFFFGLRPPIVIPQKGVNNA